MNPSPLSRGLVSLAIAVGMAVAGSALIGLGIVGGTKALGAIVGGVMLVVGAFASGNPRLFCLWGLILTIPLNLSKRFGEELPKLAGENSFRVEVSDPFWLGLLAFLLLDAWRGRQNLRIPKVTYISLLIMLLGIIWIAFGTFRTTASHEVVRMVKMMLLFVAVCNDLQRPRRFMHFAAATACSVTLQAIIGLAQYVKQAPLGLKILGETDVATTGQLLNESVRGGAVYRVGALLVHPNIFGIFLAVFLLMLISVFLIRGKRHKAVLLPGIVLGLAGLIVTFSRSSWLSFAVAVPVLLLFMTFHHGMRPRFLVWMPLATAAILSVCVVFNEPISKRLFESTPYAADGRMEWNHDALRMIGASPVIGWGMNSYPFAVPQFTKYGARGIRETIEDNRGWVPTVHNTYLLWGAELGAIGFLLHMSILGTIIWIGLRNLRVKHDLLFAMNAAAVCGILAFMTDAMLSLSLTINPTLRMFWLLAAIIMAVHYWRRTQEEQEPRAIPAAPGTLLTLR